MLPIINQILLAVLCELPLGSGRFLASGFYGSRATACRDDWLLLALEMHFFTLSAHARALRTQAVAFYFPIFLFLFFPPRPPPSDNIKLCTPGFTR